MDRCAIVRADSGKKSERIRYCGNAFEDKCCLACKLSKACGIICDHVNAPKEGIISIGSRPSSSTCEEAHTNVLRMKDVEHDINNLGGHDFEALVEELIKKMGFVVGERKLAADGGIDMIAWTNESIIGGTYIIQCKRYTQKVAEPVIRDLYGVVHSKNANKGILITNSAFTDSAIEFAKNKQLELIDGGKLQSLLAKYGIRKIHGRAVLSDSARFLVYSFAPTIRKMQEQFEDLRNQRIYLEKVGVNEKQWMNLIKATTDKLMSYLNWLSRTTGQSMNVLLGEKPANIQKIKEACDEMARATQMQIDNYRNFVSVIPPSKFSKIHEKCPRMIDSVLESVFRACDELVAVGGLDDYQLKKKAAQQQGAIVVNFRFALPDGLVEEIREEFRRTRANDLRSRLYGK
jgi:hypothetical protein